MGIGYDPSLLIDPAEDLKNVYLYFNCDGRGSGAQHGRINGKYSPLVESPGFHVNDKDWDCIQRICTCVRTRQSTIQTIYKMITTLTPSLTTTTTTLSVLAQHRRLTRSEQHLDETQCK
jgi:hypothetical protein